MPVCREASHYHTSTHQCPSHCYWTLINLRGSNFTFQTHHMSVPLSYFWAAWWTNISTASHTDSQRCIAAPPLAHSLTRACRRTHIHKGKLVSGLDVRIQDCSSANWSRTAKTTPAKILLKFVPLNFFLLRAFMNCPSATGRDYIARSQVPDAWQWMLWFPNFWLVNS